MIAVDAMGGDYAPDQIVLGALYAAQCGVPVILFGFHEKIYSLLTLYDPFWNRFPISIFNTEQVVGMDEYPVDAIRKKKDSSLLKAMQSVKSGYCSAFVSAGNTGAVMVAAKFVLGCTAGVDRPAIIGFLKTLKKNVLFLDIGANADCKAKHLVQFARMAVLYAKQTLHLADPAVSLLSNGHEPGKGSLLIKETFGLLQKERGIHFIGNIEPVGILRSETDIVVTDGFSGNIVLKTIEAMVNVFDVKNYKISDNGAFLLGVNGVVVIAHGNSNARVIKDSILLAFKKTCNKESLYGNGKKSFGRVSAKSI
jgi:glycerol-3-phosphate acyltransferase PlsX